MAPWRRLLAVPQKAAAAESRCAEKFSKFVAFVMAGLVPAINVFLGLWRVGCPAGGRWTAFFARIMCEATFQAPLLGSRAARCRLGSRQFGLGFVCNLRVASLATQGLPASLL